MNRYVVRNPNQLPIMEKFKEQRSTLDTKALAHFKQLLLDKRHEAEEELERIQQNITNLRQADDADYSSVAHHMGDVGSDIEEENINYHLLQRTKKYIEQIDSALDRIENKTYGICLATGKPIQKERLEAVPHTRYSIEAKKKGLAEDE